MQFRITFQEKESDTVIDDGRRLLPAEWVIEQAEPKDQWELNVFGQCECSRQHVLSEKRLTRRSYCDTPPFASVWIGWGRDLVNPRAQQDAFEFLQLLLDQFLALFNSVFGGQFRVNVFQCYH
jgi:hypothetical protein